MKTCSECGQDISHKRVDALTCSPGCRRRRSRRMRSQERVTLVSEVQQLRDMVVKLSDMVAALGAAPIARLDMPNRAVAAAVGPKLDDLIDSMTVRKASSSEDNNPSWNAIISLAAMNKAWASLPENVFDYGQRTNRIPSEAVVIR